MIGRVARGKSRCQAEVSPCCPPLSVSQASCSSVRLTVSSGWGESHNPEIGSIPDTFSTQKKKKKCPSSECRKQSYSSKRALAPAPLSCGCERQGGTTRETDRSLCPLFLRRALSGCDDSQVRCALLLAEACGPQGF